MTAPTREGEGSSLSPDPWSRLAELDRLLRAAGLATDTRRWLNAQDLIAKLAADRQLPRDPRALRPLLAPLFCRSPEEQQSFAALFAEWLGMLSPRPVPEPLGPVPAPRRALPQTPSWPVLLAFLLLAATALGLYLLYAAGGWLLPTLLAGAILVWLAWRALHRRDVLRYRKGDADSPLSHITLAVEDDDLFTTPALRAALRRLHAPVRQPTLRLNETATVERTARRNGLFAPVYRYLPRVPELAVLVDFHHRADHLAELAETLVARLCDAGIQVHRYSFQRDPTRVLGRRGQGLGLPELAARHPGARLLVIGDPRAFIQPWSGCAAAWTEVLALWPQRALLATRPVPAPWRAALEAGGLALAPFGEAGLIRLASHLAEAPGGAARPDGAWLPGRLDAPAALDPAPERADREAILVELDAWLGPRGGLLLAAAAVYPELHPGLTRVLDRALFPADPPEPRAQRLMRLARLPWLRIGQLPDWLRLVLCERIERRDMRRIGAIYRELLIRASVDGDEAVRLPVAVPAAGGPWRTQGWRLDLWIRGLAGLADANAPLKDRIFLDVVLRPRRLDFRLPRRLARRLLRPHRTGRRLHYADSGTLRGGGMHLLNSRYPETGGWNAVAKRAVDLIFVSIALVLLSPLMLATTLAIRLDSPGPILFRQKRWGLNNEVIEVYKFRSMYIPLADGSMYLDLADRHVKRDATKFDTRITRIGRFIRKTSIDELPQFFNVLSGELSLVGPRPRLVNTPIAEHPLKQVVEGYFGGHVVKPGITGWAQINGFRGEVDSVVKFQKQLEFDIFYIENWSILFDLYVLFRTPFALFDTENAS